MSTLVEFLRARLDEDEAEAREDPHPDSSFGSLLSFTDYGEMSISTNRVLAEVDAKRRIVDLHTPVPVDLDGELMCTECRDPRPDGNPCPTLRLLAVPYDAHPDYDPAWRP